MGVQVLDSIMKITIAEYGNVYMIKMDPIVTLEELKKLPEVVKIVTGAKAEFKLDAQ